MAIDKKMIRFNNKLLLFINSDFDNRVVFIVDYILYGIEIVEKPIRLSLDI